MPLYPGASFAPDTDIYRNGGTTRRESIPRYLSITGAPALTSGVMYSVGIVLYAGDVVTNLTFYATTGLSSPTNWWFALYDTQSTPALIAQTADQLNAAWANSSSKTLALSSPYTVTTTGLHYASICTVAATAGTLGGIATTPNVAGGLVSGQKKLGQTSGSGLTTTAPATISGGTNTNVAYCVVT